MKYTLITPVIILDAATGSTLSNLIGIDMTTVPWISNYIPLAVPKLQGVQHLFVGSLDLAKGNNMIAKSGVVSNVAMVPVDQPFGAVVHYSTQHEDLDVINYDSETNLQNISIVLYDGAGNKLDLMGQNFQMILKVYYNTK